MAIDNLITDETELDLESYKVYFSGAFDMFTAIVSETDDEDKSMITDCLVDYAKYKPQKTKDFLKFIYAMNEPDTRFCLAVYVNPIMNGPILITQDKFMDVFKNRTDELNNWLSKIKDDRIRELALYRLCDTAQHYPENTDSYMKKVTENMENIEHAVLDIGTRITGQKSKNTQKNVINDDGSGITQDNFVNCVLHVAAMYPSATEHVLNIVKNLDGNGMYSAEQIFSPIVCKNSVPALLLAEIHGMHLIGKGEEIWAAIKKDEIKAPVDLIEYVQDWITQQNGSYSEIKFELAGGRT